MKKHSRTMFIAILAVLTLTVITGCVAPGGYGGPGYGYNYGYNNRYNPSAEIAAAKAEAAAAKAETAATKAEAKAEAK